MDVFNPDRYLVQNVALALLRIDMHELQRHPDEVGRDTARQLLIRRQLLVGRSRRVDHQRLGVANVRQMTR